MNYKSLSLTISTFTCVFLVLGCSDKRKPNIELIQDMMVQPAVQSQSYDEKAPNGRTMRVPPEGTVPRGFTPYPFKAGQDLVAAQAVKNPIAGVMTAEVLAQGKKKYEIYCSVCHGFTGRGDGTVAAVMPLKPPSLVTPKVMDFPDGQIYHIIVRGRGLMGAHGTQVLGSDRWAVVNYIRSLQKSSGKSE
jgi:mono/diheme cytochrome c family protein